MFILLPLGHSEIERDAAVCVNEYTKLNEKMSTDPSISWDMSMNIKFVKAMHATLQKFGRYPTRNAALGRESTEAELIYLESADRRG